MKHGRIEYKGSVHHCFANELDQVCLSDGQILAEDSFKWMPPFEVGNIIALGLNYADHAKELAFNKPEVPLVFLKGSNTIGAHKSKTIRPSDATYMHYECELAVVIGKSGFQLNKRNAMEIVTGYTVANDYAIRDYLENYYRPNLRVKNRDGCTLIGPWLVDRQDIADPMALEISTFVNGTRTQKGTTADMIFDISSIIEYLSSFMTLSPGDVILTGTPDGIVNVNVGDEVVTEIQHVGRLLNTIIGE